MAAEGGNSEWPDGFGRGEGGEKRRRRMAQAGGSTGQTADAQRIISTKGLAFSCFPRHNPFMLDAEVSGR